MRDYEVEINEFSRAIKVNNVVYCSWLVHDKRCRISSILRRYGPKFRQIKYKMEDSRNGRCALGVLFDYGKKLRVSEMRMPALSGALLQYMNDKAGYSFKEIADWFEHEGNVDADEEYYT